MKLRPWWCLVLTTLAGSLLAALLASPAQAAVGDMTCTSKQRTTYSPGVLLAPSLQSITISVSASPCVSLSRPDITSGSATVAFQAVRSCLSLDQTISGTSAITWNTGETTVYTYNSTTATVAGQIVVTIRGTVVAGPFKGDSLTITLASPVVNVLKCLIPPGITSRDAAGTLLIQ